MKRKFALLSWLILCSALLFSCAQEKGEAKTTSAELSAEAQKVVNYLLDDWNQQFRSTNIATAISNLGMAQNDELRLEVGQHFREHTDLANNLKWWGANNYVLNNDEKIIAKYLSNAFDAEKRLPDLKETSDAVGLSEKALKSRLEFMAKAGLLLESKDTKLGYTLAEGYNRWGGPFRHNFHTVAIEGDKPFDVW